MFVSKSTKLQAPSTKQAPNLKQNRFGHWVLEIGICLGFDLPAAGRDLEFGILSSMLKRVSFIDENSKSFRRPIIRSSVVLIFP